MRTLSLMPTLSSSLSAMKVELGAAHALQLDGRQRQVLQHGLVREGVELLELLQAPLRLR